MDLDVNGMAVADLFGKNSNKENMYKVPPYQREYSWTKEEWDISLLILQKMKKDFLSVL